MTGVEICLDHFEYFIKKYEHYQKACVDPGNIHQKKTVRGSFRTVSIDMAKALSNTGKNIAPGMKLCPRCWARADTGEFSTSLEEKAHYSSEEDPTFTEESSQLESLDQSVT